MRPPIEESQILEGLSVIHLKCIGLWHAINTYLSTGRRSAGLILLTGYAIFYALPYVAFQVLSIFFTRLNLEKITFLFLNCIPTLQVFSKVSVFWFRLDEQCDLFTLLKQDFLSSIPKHKMSKAREIYVKSAKKCNLFCILAFVGIILCVSSWVLVPGIEGIDDTGAKANKVSGGWYPFPFSRTPWYQAVLCYETVLMTSHGLLISFFECVMIQPLLCLCAHFTVLGYHIATLRVSDVIHTNSHSSTQYLNDELRAILSDYELLLRYAARIQDILNVLVTIILGTGILVLIIGILQFTFAAKDFMFTFHMLTFLSYEATEVSLICFSSSALNTASTDIRFAVYSSDWYLADKKFAKTGQMMMIRTLKPLTLTAIKMYPVGVEILVGIFQFTYTAAMVLSK